MRRTTSRTATPVPATDGTDGADNVDNTTDHTDGTDTADGTADHTDDSTSLSTSAPESPAPESPAPAKPGKVDYSPEACARRSNVIEQHIEAIADTLPVTYVRDPAMQMNGRKFVKITPHLLGLAADAVQKAPELFKKRGLEDSAADLRDKEVAVRYVSENRDGVVSLGDDLTSMANEAKGRAVEALNHVIDIARGFESDRTLTPKEKQIAQRVTKTLLDAVNAQNQSIQHQKDGTKKIKEAGQSEADMLRAQLDRAKQQTDVLRGKDLVGAPADQPASPKKGRRKTLH